MDHVNTNWVLETSPGWYFSCVLVATLIMRVVLSALKAIMRAHVEGWSHSAVWTNFKQIFLGFHSKPDQSNYWFNSILGLLELMSYPILITMNAWQVIGAWIGLKVLSQWKVWEKDRATFNLFLIGNALNVILAFLFFTQFIGVRPQ